MKYLITDTRLNVGDEMHFNNLLLIKDELLFNCLINNNIVESKREKVEVTINGNIEVYSVDDYTINSDIYDYVYLVDIQENKVLVKDILPDSDYINLVIDLLKSSELDIFYSKNLMLSNVLEKCTIDEVCLKKIERRIKDYISSDFCKEEDLICVIKSLDEKISEDIIIKRDFMKSVYEEINRKNINLIIYSREEYDYIIENIKKYNIELNISNAGLFSTIDDLDDLPFL